MQRSNHRLASIALLLTASGLLVLSTRAQTLQQVLFRVQMAELLLQNGAQAKGKTPFDFVELILPGQLCSPR